jgi:hypothetical protein
MEPLSRDLLIRVYNLDMALLKYGLSSSTLAVSRTSRDWVNTGADRNSALPNPRLTSVVGEGLPMGSTGRFCAPAALMLPPWICSPTPFCNVSEFVIVTSENVVIGASIGLP